MMLTLLLSLAWAGDIEGRVLRYGDATPIAGAELQTDGREVVVTDSSGRFRLTLPDGVESTLLVSAAGHLGATVQATAPLDKPLVLFLRPEPPGAEVVVEAFRPSADLTRHHVDAEMAFETPGTYDDALRLVASLPGVNVQREYAPTAGDVSVRGSLRGDNRTYFDGIELPYLYHFNQYASAFPASQLESLDLYSSTFGAQYGDSTGAIIEASPRYDRPEGVEGHALLNAITAGADLRAPVSDRWWVGGHARRSFQDLFEGATAQFPFWPSFYDMSFRAEHEATGGAQTGLFMMAVGDRYSRAVGELDLLDPLEGAASEELYYRRDYQLAGARHAWRDGRAVLAVVHDRWLGRIEAARGLQDQRTISIPARVDWRRLIAPTLGVAAGAELRTEWTAIDVDDPGTAVGVRVAEEAPAMAWGRDLDRAFVRSRGAVYGELRGIFGPVQLIPGVRLGLDTEGWVPTTEPRLSLRWRAADQTELRLAAGRYMQRPENLQIAAFPDLPTTRSWQVGAGLDQTIAGRLEIVAEGYGKWLEDVVVQPLDAPPRVVEQGRAMGAELTVRYRIRELVFLWAWASYARAQILDDGGLWASTEADQPWSGGLVFSARPWKTLDLAVRYRAASGLPYTPIDGSIYNAGTDSWVPQTGALYSARLPTYHKIDLRLAYTWVLPRLEVTASLDVWIVPPTSAQLYPTWNYNYTEQGFVIGPTVVPLPALRLSF